MKNIGIFLSENFQFLVVKFSVYLNRHVFVMSKTYFSSVVVLTVSCSVSSVSSCLLPGASNSIALSSSTVLVIHIAKCSKVLANLSCLTVVTKS